DPPAQRHAGEAESPGDPAAGARLPRAHRGRAARGAPDTIANARRHRPAHSGNPRATHHRVLRSLIHQPEAPARVQVDPRWRFGLVYRRPFVMRIRWRGLELPSRVVSDRATLTDTYGKFTIEPFERGLGTTVGNRL